jgi:hypothetical protein
MHITGKEKTSVASPIQKPATEDWAVSDLFEYEAIRKQVPRLSLWPGILG